ncbi:MAG: hypothetical protein ACHQLQ_06965 [Candidatus Acidiferrales bacterium]
MHSSTAISIPFLFNTFAGHCSRRGSTGSLGVVFSGSNDGMLRALASGTGKVLWEYNMLDNVKTVNGVAAKGGSMGAPGPTVAGGMLFASSGYVFGARGRPGNALLVFSLP